MGSGLGSEFSDPSLNYLMEVKKKIFIKNKAANPSAKVDQVQKSALTDLLASESEGDDDFFLVPPDKFKPNERQLYI